MQAQSVVSDADSDVEKGSGGGATFTSPEPFLGSSSDPPCNPAGDAPKARIPKVTSDSFISELVSDRDQAKPSKDVRVTAAVLEEEVLPIEGEESLLCTGEALPSAESRGGPGSQWSNVDLEEAQNQQIQTGAVLDSAETCSLSSVTTFTLAGEDSYGAEEHPMWAWVSGGGCSVDSSSQLNWFSSSANTTCE